MLYDYVVIKGSIWEVEKNGLNYSFSKTKFSSRLGEDNRYHSFYYRTEYVHINDFVVSCFSKEPVNIRYINVEELINYLSKK